MSTSFNLSLDEKPCTFLTCPVCGKDNIVAGQAPMNAHLMAHRELDQPARLKIRQEIFGTFQERTPKTKPLYKA